MKKLFIIAVMCVSLIMVSGNAFAGDVGTGIITPVISGQGQGQGQGQAIDDHSTTTNYNRTFPVQGNVPLPQTNGFFTNPTPDSSFRSIRDILSAFAEEDNFCIKMTEGALERLAKGGDVESHLQVLRGNDQVPRIYDEDTDSVKWLFIAIEKPIIVDGKLKGTEKIDGLKVTAMADGEADDSDTNSLQVIGKIGLKALKDGNNYLVVTAEGAHRKVEASGWGIGFYTTGGLISDSGKQAGIVGGGTGYSKNQTGPEDRPWIQGYVGVKGVKDMPTVKAEKKQVILNNVK
jgi:hypothetical protein